MRSILVAVGGLDSDMEAVRLAGNMLRASRGNRMHIIYVIEIERTLPIDAEIPPATAKGDAVLREMEMLAESMRINAQAELVQAREVGYAVVQESVDRKVDAILMAVPHNHRYGRFTMGRAVPYVFENAPCRVILWRDNTDLPSAAGPRPWGEAEAADLPGSAEDES